MKEYVSKSELETENIAYEFAKTLKNNSVVVLNGDLGARKNKIRIWNCKIF